MKTNLNFNINIILCCLGLFVSCQKTTDLEHIPNQSFQLLIHGENNYTNQNDAAFRKIRRSPFTFEIMSINNWKGVYSLPERFGLTYSRLICNQNADLILLGNLIDSFSNQHHIVVAKFDTNGDMEWNILLETTGNHILENAIEDSGILYFIGEKGMSLNNTSFFVARIESNGDFGYAHQFISTTEIPLRKKLTLNKDQLNFEIAFDQQSVNLQISKEDGVVSNFNFDHHSPLSFAVEASPIHFVQRSIPIRRLIEGKFPPQPHYSNHLASLD